MPDLFDSPDLIDRVDGLLATVKAASAAAVSSSPALKASISGAVAVANAATQKQAAEAYRLIEEMRRTADKYERDLIRSLRWNSDGKVARTWAQVAEAVDAQLGSRQAAHARWGRLKSPARRTTTGDARRGHARPQS